MYDKYLTGNTFATGSTRLPKHKGFLFEGTDGATFYLMNDQGNTFSYNIGFTGGPNIFPMSVYSVFQMGAGLTGLYLN